jgi:membrane-bound lytic murein transglycosylase D
VAATSEAKEAKTEEAPDDPSTQKAIDEESEDLQAMKQAEATVSDPTAAAAAKLYLSAAQLGGGSVLAGRLNDLLDSDAYPNLPALPDLAGTVQLDPNVAAVFDIAKAKGEYDIPVEMRAEVAQWIAFFQGSGRKYYVRWLARSTRYMPVMKDILRQEGLPEDTVYLSMIESGFSTLAYSWAKASGPWQFIDATGRRFGLKVDFWIDERRDPIKSTRAAARYLRELHDEFDDWYLAWAGYNAGAGKVRKGIEKYHTKDFWSLCAAGRFLRPETKNYVPKLIAAALVTRHAEAFGFSHNEIEWEQPLDVDEVQVPDPTDLSVIAKAAECSLEEIQALNPELRRWLTPPTAKGVSYVLRIPKGHKEAFETNFPKVAPKERLVFKIHRVKKGDTLSKIALGYHSFPEAIMRMNGLRSSKKLRLGTELMIPVASEHAWAAAEQTSASKDKDAASTSATTTPTSASASATSAPSEVKPHKSHSGFVPTAPEEEIPAGTSTVATMASGTIQHETVDGKDRVKYGVASGDSLWIISQKFGVSVDDLKQWNDLHGKRPKLQIGQQLIVYPKQMPPDATATASTTPAPAPVPGTATTPAVAATTVAVAAPTKATATAIATAVAPATTDVQGPPAPPKPPVDVVPDKVTSIGNKKHIVHTLAPGDTLWSLSQRYGVSVDSLKKWNRLSRKAVLRPGNTLTVEVADGT